MSLAFFIEMAWKSAAIAAAALLLTALLRSRSPADRAALLRLGAAMLLLLPFVSLLLPALEVEMAAATAAAAPVSPALLTASAAPALAAPVDTAVLAPLDVAPVEPSIWEDPGALIAILYLGGLAMAAFRIGAGLFMLRRWTATARPADCLEWLSAFERARAAAGSPRVRLLVSDEAPSPLSWGWTDPVILIDADSHDRPEDAEAILAHEIAHVARRDWPALMLSRCAAALFWFNPLVRLLEREFVQQAEEAADSLALKRLDPARYAQTLVSCAELCRGSLVPANSIAGKSGLGRRVKAILDGRLSNVRPGSAWSVAAMALAVAFAAPLAALEIAEARSVERAAEAASAAAASKAAPASRAAAAEVAAPATVQAEAQAAAAAEAAGEAAAAAEDAERIGAAVEQSLAATLPRIPEIVAAAMSAVDTDAIAREASAAAAQASVEAHAEAIAAARAAADEASRITVDAVREAARARARGASGMEQGARSMEAGARQMAEEARKLRSSRAYREEQIAKAAARGQRVTHEDLLEAAEGLEEGSREMIEGAREIRRSAAEMRRGEAS